MLKKNKGLHIIALVFCLFFVIDIFLFRIFLWQLPNESAWASMPHYNFEYRLQKTQAKKDKEKLILIVGSSVALYSFLPAQLEKRLNDFSTNTGRSGIKFRVAMLAHQGMTAFHLITYLQRIIDLKPDIIVYATHPVDLRMERPFVHKNASDFFLEDNSIKKKKALKQYVHSIVSKDEFRLLSPAASLVRYWDYLERDELAHFSMALVSGSYRYKSITSKVFNQVLSNHFSNARHFHSYAGIPVNGITHRGWVSKHFSFQVTKGFLDTNWVLNAPTELFKNKIAPSLAVKVCAKGLVCKNQVITLRPGWQKIKLFGSIDEGAIIMGNMSNVFYDEQSDDTRSLRFSRNFARKSPLKRTRESRPIRREDYLYQSYSDVKYKKSFSNRLLNFNRSGTEYLKAIKDARGFWSAHKFDKKIPVFQIQNEIIINLIKNDVTVMLLNTPENPISQKWFGSRIWYNGYIKFLKQDRGSSYKFYNYHSRFPMQDFYDYHHLTYFGAKKMTDYLFKSLTTKIKTNSPQFAHP